MLRQHAAAAAKSHQSCLTLCDPIDSSPPGWCPWDSPGKNTGVGCHFLLSILRCYYQEECWILDQPKLSKSTGGGCQVSKKSLLWEKGKLEIRIGKTVWS